jgi:hypothetical protein
LLQVTGFLIRNLAIPCPKKRYRSEIADKYLAVWESPRNDRERIGRIVGTIPAFRRRLENIDEEVHGMKEKEERYGMRWRFEELTKIVAYLDNLKIPFALVHEAALAAWGIDNNMVLSRVDVLVPEGSLPTLASDTVIRPWARLAGGETFESVEKVRVADYGCLAASPEAVLANLPSSPDFMYLREQYAGLALILFHDELTDAGLARFRRYVRSV